LFSGCGGTSLGAAQAGLEVVWAANHWPAAVELHRRRHPKTIHVCQDLQQFDWRALPDHEILWASPACQGHSEAAQPARSRDRSLAHAHDRLRSTAWAIVSACEAKQPRSFVVENVPEFREWRLLPAWRAALGLLGYRLTEQVLTASKWGVPQRRRRLIIVGHLDRELRIDEPDVEHEPTLEGVLDPEDPEPEWIEIEDIATPGARRRAQHAHRTFGGRPCWGWHVSHRGAWARTLAQPANTLTTKNQHYLVADGHYRLWTVDETLGAQGFPVGYLDGVPRTQALVMAGNAVPPGLAKGVLEQVARSLR
jgi:DNA (cytosine-5)-methyltransferase 1